MEDTQNSADSDVLLDGIRNILFGNLSAWKEKISKTTPINLKKFIVQELQQMETKLYEYCHLLVKKECYKSSQNNSKSSEWLLQQHLEALALLKTIEDSSLSFSSQTPRPQIADMEQLLD